MLNADTLYYRSPVFLQRIAVGVWGVGWFKRRYGPLFRKSLAEFEQRDFWTAEQFRAYQEERLNLLFLAASKSPYYRELFDSLGISRSTPPWEALARMPLLSKDTVRDRGRDFLTEIPVPKGTKIFRTSGSTGTPLSIYYPPAYHAVQSAVTEVRNLNEAGVHHRSRRFMCGGRKVCRFDQRKPPFWRLSPIENLAYASSYHLSEEFLPAYMDFLRKFKPEVVMGYPSSLTTIARFAVEHQAGLPAAKMVSTNAEAVSPEQRGWIESAWQCALYDRYGTVEGAAFIGQCRYGNYHVSPDVGVLEILDPHGRACAPGELGEIVSTGLHNTLQPLIRYRVGDTARWAVRQDCRCGRQTPIVEAIEGRVEDICFTPDGRRMNRFHAVYYGCPGIKEAQLVQDSLRHFTIYVVPNAQFSPADIRTVQSNMKRHVGEVEVEVKTVDVIPRTASGKFRAVLSRLSPEERRSILAGSGDGRP